MKHDAPDAAIVDILRETPTWAKVALALVVAAATLLLLVALVTRIAG